MSDLYNEGWSTWLRFHFVVLCYNPFHFPDKIFSLSRVWFSVFRAMDVLSNRIISDYIRLRKKIDNADISSDFQLFLFAVTATSLSSKAPATLHLLTYVTSYVGV
jgi:hypothetical protein